MQLINLREDGVVGCVLVSTDAESLMWKISLGKWIELRAL